MKTRDTPPGETPAGIDTARPPAAARLADGLDFVLVTALYGWFTFRLAQSVWRDGQIANLVLLVSEGMVVVFVLGRRRASCISERPLDWVLAVAATCLPLFARRAEEPSPVPPLVGAALMAAGTVLQVAAKVVLGRSFGCVPAHRGIKRSGPYRLIRHPIYAGYLVGHLGFLALNPTAWNAAIYLIGHGLQLPRLLAEERLLRGDPTYRDYCEAVPYRLIPWVF